MYLLNEQVELQWELLATASPPVLGDLDLIIIDPEGVSTYYDAPFDVGNYTAPTVSTNGLLTDEWTPSLEGLYRFRLVIGDSSSYQIIAKSDAQVFDSTVVTPPYNEIIGRTIPYDIQFSMQGFFVPDEYMGMFVAARVINIYENADGSQAVVRVPGTTSTTICDILKNGVVIGSVTFPALSYTGTFDLPEFFTLSPGETLMLKTQGSVDSNLEDIAVNINARVTIVEY